MPMRPFFFACCTRVLFRADGGERVHHRLHFSFKLYVVGLLVREHAAQAGVELMGSCSRGKLQNILRIYAGSGNNRDAFLCRHDKRFYFCDTFGSAGRSTRSKDANSARRYDIFERLRKIRTGIESAMKCHRQGFSEFNQFVGAIDIHGVIRFQNTEDQAVGACILGLGNALLHLRKFSRR